MWSALDKQPIKPRPTPVDTWGMPRTDLLLTTFCVVLVIYLAVLVNVLGGMLAA